MLSADHLQRVRAAIDLIDQVPGYGEIARDLLLLLGRQNIRFAADINDRAHAGLTGVLHLGAEALEAEPLSLAETLVHEHYHVRRQNPFEKTVSFWSGVVTRVDPMRRYERPAYLSAVDFLRAVAEYLPDRAEAARAEEAAVAQSFADNYGASLY